MHTTIKKLGVSILCAGLMLPSVAGATTATSTEALMAQIKALQTQIAGLQEQAKTLKTQTATLQQTQNELIHSLKMTMKEGMSGDDIKALQALLAADPSIYPEGKITGYYGPMTTKAVKRFQEKHGFEKVGFVGKKTLGKLNELMQDNPMRFEHATSTAKSEDENENDKEKKLCAIIPPGHEIAKGWLKNNEKPLVPTCQTLPKGIERKLEFSSSISTDITPVTISEMKTTSITSTGATVSWKTSRPETGALYFGTTAPVSDTGTPAASSSVFTKDHSFTLSGLTASTTYYFLVVSKNVSGTAVTSSTGNFVTLQ